MFQNVSLILWVKRASSKLFDIKLFSGRCEYVYKLFHARFAEIYPTWSVNTCCQFIEFTEINVSMSSQQYNFLLQ